MKKSVLFASVLTMTLLQACGGGSGDGNAGVTPPPGGGDTGGNGGDSTTPPVTGGDEGSVSAPFAWTDSGSSYYMLFSQNVTSAGPLRTELDPGGLFCPEVACSRGPIVQTASGALARVSQFSVAFTGNTGDSPFVTKNIAGDANYALGRWVQGTVVQSTLAAGVISTTVLPGTDEGSYHYVAYNIPASFPATGNYACALQSGTTPTRVSGSGPDTGAFSGDALALSFDAGGAHPSGALSISIGNETLTTSLPTRMVASASLGITGEFLANGPGAAAQVADAGSGGYALAVGVTAQSANGALYRGIAYLRCSGG